MREEVGEKYRFKGEFEIFKTDNVSFEEFVRERRDMKVSLDDEGVVIGENMFKVFRFPTTVFLFPKSRNKTIIRV